MLESISERLMEPGEAHYRCPDKYPKARIKTISDAGKLNIPWTSGILIGIGENWEERVDSIIELKRINDEFGHNAEPIFKGTCCDECNMIFVIPARLEGMSEF